MIRSFADRRAEVLFRTEQCPAEWRSFEAAAIRKLSQLHAAITVGDLASPPGNRLEKLAGDRAGQWSIRINRQWRICFVWKDDAPEMVEIVDYH